jgi:hypothetical protein
LRDIRAIVVTLEKKCQLHSLTVCICFCMYPTRQNKFAQRKKQHCVVVSKIFLSIRKAMVSDCQLRMSNPLFRPSVPLHGKTRLSMNDILHNFGKCTFSEIFQLLFVWNKNYFKKRPKIKVKVTLEKTTKSQKERRV